MSGQRRAVKGIVSKKEEQGERSSLEGYLESIMSSMTDALIVVDLNGRIRSVNAAASHLLGYEKDELIGQQVIKIFLKEEEDALQSYLKNIVVPSVGYPIALSFLTKQAEAIPVNLNCSLLQRDGASVGIVGVARDIRRPSDLTDASDEKDRYYLRMRKAMLHIMDDLAYSRKETEMANIELRKLDLLKSDFLSTASHELRTPLTVTREAISQVVDGIHGEINKEQEQYLSMSIEGIDRLSRLIENLLDISKIDAHRMRLKRGLLDIVGLAKGVGSSFAPAFRAKSLEAKYDVHKDRIELYADEDKIIGVFVNLLGNALKFTPAGSIEISVVEKEDCVECSVSDTGIGISDEDLSRVFHKFDQLDQESDRREKGTGLGLAISKGIVELHGGRIWAESKLGRGTKVLFTLPKYSPRNLFREYLRNGLAEAADEGSSLCILIFDIEDYKALQERSGHDKIASMMGGLEQLIKAELRRKADICIKVGGEIVVGLPGTETKSARTTAERLNSCVSSYLAKLGLAQDVAFRSKIAGFPEDAVTAEDLLNKVRWPE